jgi:hypothetical protein
MTDIDDTTPVAEPEGSRTRLRPLPALLGVVAALVVVGLVVGLALRSRDGEGNGGDGEIVGDDATITTTVPATTGSTTTSEPTTTPAPTLPTPAPEGPSDLAVPEPGREITFAGAGDVTLGDALDPALVTSHEGSACGYWGPQEPSHDGDEPLRGLAAGATSTAPTVATVEVRNNPRYRTASGVGIGTTLASLERIYGDDLVVDRADGWEHPTGDLLAQYQDVAAVRNGAHALTFSLTDDAVSAVKVSDAEFWGDDEGCA